MADTTVAPKAPDFYVYILFNPLTCEPFYVGKGRNGRCMWHFHQAHKCRNAKERLIHMLRLSRLEVPVVKIAEGLGSGAAYEVECALIAALGRAAYGGLLLNRTAGGGGLAGWNHSEDSRSKISSGNKGKKRSPESNHANALRQTGKKLSEETRRKIAEAGLGRKRVNPMSAEARRRIGDSKLGKPWALTGIYKHSDGVRAHLKKRWSGRPDADQTRRRVGDRSRGKHWYNNGTDQNFYDDGRQPEGWVRGMLPHPLSACQLETLRSNAKGKIRITNGTTEKLWSPDQPLPDGWQRGRSGVMVAALKRPRKR